MFKKNVEERNERIFAKRRKIDSGDFREKTFQKTQHDIVMQVLYIVIVIVKSASVNTRILTNPGNRNVAFAPNLEQF